MKICILGADGKSGRRLVTAALASGHNVTALVRDLEKFGYAANANLEVRAVSFADEAQLVEAMADHDAVINAAGYITAGRAYTELVQCVIGAADKALGQGGRFWLFGGAALLDVPSTSLTALDLPGVPKMFEAHRANYQAVRASALDWSMLCPGPMIDAPDGKPTEALVVSTDVWPVARPAFTYLLPRPALSLAFKGALPRLTIYYEDAARVMIDNLERDRPLSRKRVGVALPRNEKRIKPNVPS
jgi:uncharacterized protein